VEEPTPRRDAAVYTFDGVPVLGDERAARGARRFAAIFEQHDDITTVIHIHTPYLGAWRRRIVHCHQLRRRAALHTGSGVAGLHRPDAGRGRLHPGAARAGRRHPGDRRSNGGATVWGRAGLSATVQFIQLLEEGAQYQTLAQEQGGSQEYGAGVLAQQWAMTGLTEAARRKNLLADQICGYGRSTLPLLFTLSRLRSARRAALP